MKITEKDIRVSLEKLHSFGHSNLHLIIIKDLQIHRPQLASTNRSYLQVNYIFLVLPSEI